MFTEAVEGRRMTNALFASFKIRRVFLLLSEAIDDLFSCFSTFATRPDQARFLLLFAVNLIVATNTKIRTAGS